MARGKGKKKGRRKAGKRKTTKGKGMLDDARFLLDGLHDVASVAVANPIATTTAIDAFRATKGKGMARAEHTVRVPGGTTDGVHGGSMFGDAKFLIGGAHHAAHLAAADPMGTAKLFTQYQAFKSHGGGFMSRARGIGYRIGDAATGAVDGMKSLVANNPKIVTGATAMATAVAAGAARHHMQAAGVSPDQGFVMVPHAGEPKLPAITALGSVHIPRHRSLEGRLKSQARRDRVRSRMGP